MLRPINLSQAISHSSQRREGEPIVVIPKREDNAGAQNIIEHRSGPHRPAEVNRWKS